MSERGCSRLTVPMLVLLVALSSALGGSRVDAQDRLDSLRVRRDTARERFRVADSTFRAVAARGETSIETLTVAGVGMKLRVSPVGLLGDRDLAALSEGLQQGVAELERRYGAVGRALVDTASWRVYQNRWRGRGTLWVNAGRGGGSQQVSFERPVDPAAIARFIVRRAGERLAARAPALNTYAGYGFSLTSSDTRLALAAREMSVAPAGPVRRCAEGSLADCRRTLTAATGPAGFALWHDPDQHRIAVAYSAWDFPLTDTLSRGLRRTCLAGVDADCARLLEGANIRPPYSNVVRFTFVEHALELIPAERFDLLVGSRAADPIALLAEAAGISTDSLIMGWQRRAAAALVEDRETAFPVFFASAMWSLVLFGVAAGRRGMR